jgi:hypothetical protein
MKVWKPFSLRLIALGEWLLILPASALLMIAALRLLQPAQFEPAYTSSLILNWTTAHISRFGSAILFLGMPGIVAVVGLATLWRAWHADPELRQDAATAAAILQRRIAIFVVMIAMVLATAVLTLVVGHLITD